MNPSFVLATPIPFAEQPFIAMVGLGLWIVKLFGYFYFARWLCRQYGEVEVNPAFFAVCRATVGVVAGVLLMAALPWADDGPSPYSRAVERSPTAQWYAAVVGSRVVEWLGMLWLFFARHIGIRSWQRVVMHTALGTAWSVCLDGVVGVVVILAGIVGFMVG